MGIRAFPIFLFFFSLLSAPVYSDPIEDPEELELVPAPKHAYYRYLKARRLQCTGDGEKLPKSQTMTIRGRSYTYTGPSLKSDKPDPDGKVVLGVLGAVKDFTPEARVALNSYLDKFTRAGADALVLLGDLASTEFEITQVLLTCAKTGLPVLALIGNTEGRAAFNRAVLAALKVSPNIINLNVVRKVDLGGAVLIGLPGYRNRKFVHQTGGCAYKPRDVRGLSALAKDAPDPVVLLCHGPPRGEGPEALDFASEGGNVGDALLRDFLLDGNVSVGIFSHILEAGGRALDRQGKQIPPGQFVDHFWINVGSANPLAWQLNSGKDSCGMAALVRIKKAQASFSFLHNPCPK